MTQPETRTADAALIAATTQTPTQDNTGVKNAAAQIEDELAALKDARDEERFGWIVVSIILFDCLIFANMENWAGALVIGVLQLLLLLGLAKRLGVDYVVTLLTRLLHRISDRADK